MSTDNTPKGTVTDNTPANFQGGVNAIENLLDDSLLDDDANTEDEDQGDEVETEADDAEEEALEGDESEGDDAEDETDELDDEQADGEDDDESDAEASQGRFVAHDAKVRLPDGTVTTVGALAKSPLLQSDYTRKTTELANERSEFDRAKQDLTGYAQQIRAERDFLLQFAQNFLPQPPDKSMMETDIIGYQMEKAAYDEKMAELNAFRGQAQQQSYEDQQRQQAEVQKQINDHAHQLIAEMPELADVGKFQKFMADTAPIVSTYGFTQAELDQVTDPRFFKVFRDLQRLHKITKSAKKVKKDLPGKPVLKGGKRMDPKKKANRDVQARAARAKQSGNFEAGVAALQDLDL